MAAGDAVAHEAVPRPDRSLHLAAGVPRVGHQDLRDPFRHGQRTIGQHVGQVLSDQRVETLGRRVLHRECHERQAQCLVVQAGRISAVVGAGEDVLGVPVGQTTAVEGPGGGRARGDARRAGQRGVGDARRVQVLVVVDDRVPTRVADHVNQKSGVAVEQTLVNGAVVADEVLVVHDFSAAPGGGVLAFGASGG